MQLNVGGLDFALTCTNPKSTMAFRLQSFTLVLVIIRTWHCRVLTLQLTLCMSVLNSSLGAPCVQIILPVTLVLLLSDAQALL